MSKDFWIVIVFKSGVYCNRVLLEALTPSVEEAMYGRKDEALNTSEIRLL